MGRYTEPVECLPQRERVELGLEAPVDERLVLEFHSRG